MSEEHPTFTSHPTHFINADELDLLTAIESHPLYSSLVIKLGVLKYGHLQPLLLNLYTPDDNSCDLDHLMHILDSLLSEQIHLLDECQTDAFSHVTDALQQLIHLSSLED